MPKSGKKPLLGILLLQLTDSGSQYTDGLYSHHMKSIKTSALPKTKGLLSFRNFTCSLCHNISCTNLCYYFIPAANTSHGCFDILFPRAVKPPPSMCCSSFRNTGAEELQAPTSVLEISLFAGCKAWINFFARTAASFCT